MELRSTLRKNEYKELQLTLNGMGFYEEGMELQEMRQVLNALQMSTTESESSFSDSDMQQALRESEMDFLPTQNDRVLNSTMMSVHSSMSPYNSPENKQSERIILQAEVHHAMDWSPPNERLPRKSLASASREVDRAKCSIVIEECNELLESGAERFHDILCASNEAINSHDKSKNLVEECFNNSLDNIDFSERSLEMSTNSLHDILGPVSERRIHDSGLIQSFEIPHSSHNNTSQNITCSSTASLNNLQNSIAELSNSIHEIYGPVSVRRIHDSGLNISTDTPNSSVVHNSVTSSDNSIQFSANSRVGNQYDLDDESEN